MTTPRLLHLFFGERHNVPTVLGDTDTGTHRRTLLIGRSNSPSPDAAADGHLQSLVFQYAVSVQSLSECTDDSQITEHPWTCIIARDKDTFQFHGMPYFNRPVSLNSTPQAREGSRFSENVLSHIHIVYIPTIADVQHFLKTISESENSFLNNDDKIYAPQPSCLLLYNLHDYFIAQPESLTADSLQETLHLLKPFKNVLISTQESWMHSTFAHLHTTSTAPYATPTSRAEISTTPLKPVASIETLLTQFSDTIAQVTGHFPHFTLSVKHTHPKSSTLSKPSKRHAESLSTHLPVNTTTTETTHPSPQKQNPVPHLLTPAAEIHESQVPYFVPPLLSPSKTIENVQPQEKSANWVSQLQKWVSSKARKPTSQTCSTLSPTSHTFMSTPPSPSSHSKMFRFPMSQCKVEQKMSFLTTFDKRKRKKMDGSGSDSDVDLLVVEFELVESLDTCERTLKICHVK